ncbi:MAG: hypothetical protein JNL38_08270 [Myxococcales bacterium]|nr:hypothetical protein [Myxococcales bacterium]
MDVRRAMAVALVSLALAASAACSALVDLGGLRGAAPADAGPRADAPPAPSAPSADAARDVAVADGGDAGAASPCEGASPHLLCADFDGAELLAGGFTAVQRNGTLEASTARSVSAPRSLLSAIPRRDAGASNVYNTLTYAGQHWRRVRLEMDVYLEAAAFSAGDSAISFALVSFSSPSAATGTNLFFDASSNAASVEHLLGADRYFDIPTLRRNAWSHVVLDFDPVGGSYRFTVDGAEGAKAFPGIAAPPGSHTMTVELGVIGYGAPTPAARVHYDNVVVDLP